MGNNGNGLFWGFWGNASTAWLLNGMNNNNNHDNTVDLIANNTMWQNQLMNQQNLANQTTLITQGFCNTNSNIEKAILQSQQNTANIIASWTANTQRILDFLCNQETQRLRTDLAEAKLESNNANQTATLIQALRPYPVPAYEVSSPYGTTTPATA